MAELPQSKDDGQVEGRQAGAVFICLEDAPREYKLREKRRDKANSDEAWLPPPAVG